MAESERLERTLALARSGLAPSATDRQRLRAALALDSALAPVAGQAPEATTPGLLPGHATPAASQAVSGWTAIKASGKVGAISGLLLMGAGFAGGYWVNQRETSPAPAAMLAPLPAATSMPGTSMAATASETISPNTMPLPRSVPEPRAPIANTLETEKPRRHRKGKANPGGASSADDAFDRELALLQRVERALRNEDPALASSLLALLDAEHPRGARSEERQAARVMAQCQAKEVNAHLAGQRFLRAVPRSVYTDRVRSFCGLQLPGEL